MEPTLSKPPTAVSTILVTGGAGFIGSNFLHRLVPRFPDIQFVVADKLTYAGNLASLEPLPRLSNFVFEQVDLAEAPAVEKLFLEYPIDWIFHFAAETHVDRSIRNPRESFQSNLLGTFNLLEAARSSWSAPAHRLFHHVSTDEVFGSLGSTGQFTECTPYDPSSPYAATKAGSDHLCRAYSRTYGLPVRISNCSNNYGPRQFPEKLIPLMILAAHENRPLPVYGTGSNVRDWLYVDDHVDAIWQIASRGKNGEIYAIGGDSDRTNLEVVQAICKSVAELQNRDPQKLLGLISFVEDRPGHDFRYSIDASKIREELGWVPAHTFQQGLHDTVAWYLTNMAWVKSVQTGEYRRWMAEHYQDRAKR